MMRHHLKMGKFGFHMIKLTQLIGAYRARFLMAWGFGAWLGASAVLLNMLSAHVLWAGAIITLNVAIALLACVRMLARYGELLVGHDAIFRLLSDLRVRIFRAWLATPMAARTALFFDPADNRTLLTDDIDALDQFALKIISPMVTAAMACVAMVLAAAYLSHGSAFWLVMVGAPVLMMACALLALQKSAPHAQRAYDNTRARARMLGVYAPISAQMVLWGQRARLCKQTAPSLPSQDVARIASYARIVMHALVLGMVVVALYFGTGVARFVLAFGALALAEFVLPLISDGGAWGKVLAAKARINALTQVAHAPKSAPSIRALRVDTMPVMGETICARTAFLAHNGITHLKGRSGVGKSMLLSAIAGECAHRGKIQVLTDDSQGAWQDIGDFDASLISYMGQAAEVFDISLYDNITLGRAACDDTIWALLGALDLADWARALPRGLDTTLGQFGTAISGGQARRVALARILLAPAPIILLDEPFVGLDSATKAVVIDTLRALDGHIIIITSHDDLDFDVVNFGQSH